jgi:hypothetical protein
VSNLSRREDIASRIVAAAVTMEWDEQTEFCKSILHQMKLGKCVFRAYAAAAVEFAEAIITESGDDANPRAQHGIDRLTKFGGRYIPVLAEQGIRTVGKLAAKHPEDIVSYNRLSLRRAQWLIQEAQDYLEAKQ